MCHRPVLLSRIVGRKQTIVDSISDFDQSTGDRFGKSLFIEDFVDELMGGNKHSGYSKGSQSIDRT